MFSVSLSPFDLRLFAFSLASQLFFRTTNRAQKSQPLGHTCEENFDKRLRRLTDPNGDCDITSARFHLGVETLRNERESARNMSRAKSRISDVGWFTRNFIIIWVWLRLFIPQRNDAWNDAVGKDESGARWRWKFPRLCADNTKRRPVERLGENDFPKTRKSDAIVGKSFPFFLRGKRNFGFFSNALRKIDRSLRVLSLGFDVIQLNPAITCYAQLGLLRCLCDCQTSVQCTHQCRDENDNSFSGRSAPWCRKLFRSLRRVSQVLERDLVTFWSKHIFILAMHWQWNFFPS